VTHRRSEIRAEVLKRLKDKTEAGNRVYDSKFTPIQNETLFPCLVIFITEELVSEASSASELYDRRASLDIAVLTLSDIGDTLCAQVETQMKQINHPDFSFSLKGTKLDVNPALTKTSYITTLNYSCFYRTEECAESLSDSLNTLSLELSHVQ